MAFAYGESLKAGISTGMEWGTAKMLEMYGQEVNDVGSKKGADSQETRN